MRALSNQWPPPPGLGPIGSISISVDTAALAASYADAADVAAAGLGGKGLAASAHGAKLSATVAARTATRMAKKQARPIADAISVSLSLCRKSSSCSALRFFSASFWQKTLECSALGWETWNSPVHVYIEKARSCRPGHMPQLRSFHDASRGFAAN